MLCRPVLLCLLLAVLSVQGTHDRDMRRSYDLRYAGFAQPSSAASPSQHEATNTNSTHEIFLVPHTHDDVGWQKTVGAYFDSSVTHILSTVTADLTANRHHRFIWSEVKWLEMWWPLQSADTQQKFKQVVSNGQFEFVGAGWSQSDEVTPSYRDMIDNTVTGHEFLRRTLGDACPNARCVRFGWQIDMFAGYSATTPSLWAMMGYDAMVIRFEGPDWMRAQWDHDQDYEFIWEGSEVLEANRSRILTHAMRWNYGDMLLEGRSGPQYGFRGPTLSFDFSARVLHNQSDVERYAEALVHWSKNRGSVYQGDRHLAAWGSDFQFSNAGLWFEQMDLLLTEINAHPEKYSSHIRYATLSEYFDHLHSVQGSSHSSPLVAQVPPPRKLSPGQLSPGHPPPDVSVNRSSSTSPTSSTPPIAFPVKRFADFEYGWPHSWVPVGIPLVGLTQNNSAQFQTGAPASRPAYKKRVRASAAQLRAAQTVHVLALLKQSDTRMSSPTRTTGAAATTSTAAALSASTSTSTTSSTTPTTSEVFMVAWDALGIAQHHDSVPGTMSTAQSVNCPDELPSVDSLERCGRCNSSSCMVLEDYNSRLDAADNATAALLEQALAPLARLHTGTVRIVNDGTSPSASYASTSDDGVLLFNPLPHSRTELVYTKFTMPSEYQANGRTNGRTNGHTNRTFVIPSVVDMRDPSNPVAVPAQASRLRA
jgi:hypothetical protein